MSRLRTTVVLLLVAVVWIPSAQALAPLCRGQGTTDEETAALRKRQEGSGFYRFAVSVLGEPVSCEIAWQSFDGGRFGTLVYLFAKKATLRLETAPPETFINEIEAPGGLDGQARARAFLEKDAAVAGFKVDWAKPPELKMDGKRLRKVWWDPDEGSNASASMTFEKKKLVAIRLSAAL